MLNELENHYFKEQFYNYPTELEKSYLNCKLINLNCLIQLKFLPTMDSILFPGRWRPGKEVLPLAEGFKNY